MAVTILIDLSWANPKPHITICYLKNTPYTKQNLQQQIDALLNNYRSKLENQKFNLIYKYWTAGNSDYVDGVGINDNTNLDTLRKQFFNIIASSNLGQYIDKTRYTSGLPPQHADVSKLPNTFKRPTQNNPTTQNNVKLRLYYI